jgi:hypothetical protein
MSNMLDILKNFDDAGQGKKPAGPADAGSMKSILESIQSVEECGDMPMNASAPQMAPGGGQEVTVSVTASGKENVADLISLMQQAAGIDNAPQLPVVHDHEPEMELPAKGQEMDMATMRSIMSAGEDDEAPAEEEASENWANSPDEEYGSEDDIIATGDDMHRPKNPKAIRVKDPAVESIRDQLWAALSEKKTAEGRGAIMAGRGRGKKKLKASRGNEDIKTTEGSRGKKSRGKKSRG